MKSTRKILSVVLTLAMLVQMLAILSLCVSAVDTLASGYVVNQAKAETNVKWEVTTDGTDTIITFTIDPAAAEKVQTTTLFGTNPETGNLIGYGQQNSLAWGSYTGTITKMIIGDGITDITGSVAMGNSKLKVVEIPATLVRINSQAFEGCINLGCVYIAGNTPVNGEADLTNIEKINDYTFDGAYALTSVKMNPNYTSNISTETFKNTKLTEFTAPEGLTTIGAKAFSLCSNLTKVTVLGMDTVIDAGAFSDGKSVNYITNITIYAHDDSKAQTFAKENSLKYVSLDTNKEIDYSLPQGEAVVSGDCGNNVKYQIVKNDDGEDTYTMMYYGTGTTIDIGHNGWGDWTKVSYADYLGKITKGVVSGNITNLGTNAFAGMTHIKTIYLKSIVNTFGITTFASDYELSSIVVGDETVAPVEGQYDLSNITNLGGYTFINNCALKTIKFNTNLAKIDTQVFQGCKAIETIEIPTTINEIGAEAFKDCTALKSVKIANAGTIIGADAFKNIAKDATIIGYNNTSAQTVADENGYTFDSLGDVPTVVKGHVSAIYNNAPIIDNDWEYDMVSHVLTITSNTKPGAWNESGSVLTAGSWKAYNEEIEEVIIVGSVGKISNNAFAGAKSLKKVTYTGCAQIDYNAFAGCTNLTTISIAGRQEIPGVADFSPVTTLSVSKNWAKVLTDTAVKGIILSNTVYSDTTPIKADNLPNGLETIYGASEYLENFAKANGYSFIPFGKCSATVYWTLNNGKLTIDGEGSVEALNGIDRFAASVTEISIGKGITEIKDNALAALTNLTKATFKGNSPATVGTTVFGTQSADFKVYYIKNAEGFVLPTWYGYALEEITYKSGDANGDDEINIKDAVLLAQYLAQWNVSDVIGLDAADCNGDGDINVKDAVLLAQYLAQWDVTLG